MFQVALPSQTSCASPALQLPRTISRATFTDISLDALAAAAAHLAPVPFGLIRHGLRAKGGSIQAGTADRRSRAEPSALERAKRKDLRDVGLLASKQALPLRTRTRQRRGKFTRARNRPRRALHQTANRSPSSHAALALPVLLITLPSPPSSAIIHAWMYIGRLDAALGSLLPLPPSFLPSLSSSFRGVSAADVIASTLRTPHLLHPPRHLLFSSSGGNIATLMSHAAHVKELRQTMIALGVYDPALWDALDLVWEVVLGGMGRCTV
ncbi:Clampless protein 1 [Mycena sanguinolenta]|uniref:Clampless protein 1 n=1 Tax=Mycena sanguinolenta TaxID=230812 RepID=A0A8H6YY46_9AGAR|nr:Clampless protein 1 [Mycena sanguinolenta]